jgi:hypothetical protein
MVMEQQSKQQETNRPVVVPIRRAAAGSLDEWLKELRQPGPPRILTKSAAEMLHEARAER